MLQREEVNFSAREFLDRLRGREPEAMETVVHAYTEHIYRAGLGLGFNTGDARDLTQEVWATFFDVVSSFRGDSHIRTFIFGILYNKASERRREKIRQDAADSIDDILENRFDANGGWVKPPVDPETFLIASETMSLIENCLESLPLHQRMAFFLKEIEGEVGHNICKILNVTVTNLGVLLFRARNRLRECIENKSKS